MAIYEPRAKRNGVPVSVQYIFMTLTSRHTEPHLHYHEYTELLCGVSGEALVYIGASVYRLSKGDMVIIHNDSPHDVVTVGDTCSYHVVKFLPKILLTNEQTYSEYSYVWMLMEHMTDKQVLFPADELAPADIGSLFSHMKTEWDQQDLGYELSLRADVTRIYLYILRRWREKNRSLMESAMLSSQRDLIQRAISHIREHYAELTEEETARACGVSASYLSRTFKRSLGVSFSAYLTDVRLREAERLLLTTDDSITDIAQAVGFSTSSYFISKFRVSHKLSPHRYRALHRGTALVR